MSDEIPRREPSPVRAALWSVALVGLVLSAGAALASGARAGLGVGIGAAISLANLWVMGRLVAAFVAGAGRRLPWSLVAVLKLAAVFAGLFFVVRAGAADLVPLAVGVGALPLGIVVAQLRAPAGSPQQQGS